MRGSQVWPCRHASVYHPLDSSVCLSQAGAKRSKDLSCVFLICRALMIRVRSILPFDETSATLSPVQRGETDVTALTCLQFAAVNVELLQSPAPAPGAAVQEAHDQQVLQLVNLGKAEA